MAEFHRIVQAQWADSAMTGDGARLWGGRWNPPGLPAVYLAESRALAALEILVHAPPEAIRLDWRCIALKVPDEWTEVANAADLPDDWRHLPSSPGARRFGEKWLREGGAVALRLPSMVVPEEQILLVNPAHPDFRKLAVSAARVFRYDPRF